MEFSFGSSTNFTIKEEGGYTNSARDSGNWSSGVVYKGSLIGSNMGVGAPALIAWNNDNHKVDIVTSDYMRNLPVETYKDIASENYWHVMSCNDLPTGVDLMTFDYGWNCGCSAAIHQLQEAVGVTIDGQFGPKSLKAVDAIENVSGLLLTLAAIQITHYNSLYNFKTYGIGWIARTNRRLLAAQDLLNAYKNKNQQRRLYV